MYPSGKVALGSLSVSLSMCEVGTHPSVCAKRHMVPFGWDKMCPWFVVFVKSLEPICCPYYNHTDKLKNDVFLLAILLLLLYTCDVSTSQTAFPFLFHRMLDALV